MSPQPFPPLTPVRPRPSATPGRVTTCTWCTRPISVSIGDRDRALQIHRLYGCQATGSR